MLRDVSVASNYITAAIITYAEVKNCVGARVINCLLFSFNMEGPTDTIASALENSSTNTVQLLLLKLIVKQFQPVYSISV